MQACLPIWKYRLLPHPHSQSSGWFCKSGLNAWRINYAGRTPVHIPAEVPLWVEPNWDGALKPFLSELVPISNYNIYSIGVMQNTDIVKYGKLLLPMQKQQRYSVWMRVQMKQFENSSTELGASWMPTRRALLGSWQPRLWRNKRVIVLYVRMLWLN